jgi:hypothetical protein
MNVTEQAQETERKLGRYKVIERTARRLVIESQRPVLITIGVMWALFVPIAAAIAPWMGDTRLLIAAGAALTLLLATLMVVFFTPTRRRIEIDLDAGAFRLGRSYLLPWQGQVKEVPVRSVTAIRRRRHSWGARGEDSRTEWSVKLVDEDGQTWSLVERAEEKPSAELSRLVAEVAGCPMEGSS